VIILRVRGEEEAVKFLIYLLLNYREPIMAYRGGGFGRQGLIILMGLGQELMLAVIEDEPAECRDSDYYALSEFTKLSCGKGMPKRDVIINSSVMFVLRGFELLIEKDDNLKEIISRGVGLGTNGGGC